jgi:hypothetical protein
MKVLRVEPSSGALVNLLRIWRDKPDVVVARLEDGNVPLLVGGARLVSILESHSGRASRLKQLLVRGQARASLLFVAQDRPAGVGAALRWRLPLDRIRLAPDTDGAIIDELASERRYRRGRRAWHRP